MILCDIGNSGAKFLDNGKFSFMPIDKFLDFTPKNKIYYINVNRAVLEKLKYKKFINLEPYFKIDSSYVGMGIDRIAACAYIKDGVIVDAGSAITIDVMSMGASLGGFILPGINAYLRAYKDVSPVLDVPFNSFVDIDAFPMKTSDAVSYGIVKSVILMIKDVAKNKKIYFTGGDGHYFSKFFAKSIYDKTLIFRSMQKLIEEKGIK